MNLIDTFFAYSNFILFLCLVGYLYKRYAKKQLYEAMEQDLAALPLLERERKALVQQERNSIIALEQQEYVAEMLQKKIMTWQRNIQLQQQERQLAREYISHQLQQQQHQQRDYYTHLLLQKAAIPQILTQVQEEVTSPTQQPTLSRLWIAKILETMDDSQRAS